jgi:hypothetical protein
MVKAFVGENKKTKFFRSENYNYNFSKETGYFERWGKTKSEDPIFAPAPEILDLEITSGKCSGSCLFCYKGNFITKEAINMSLDTFKKILDKFPKFGSTHFLTQVALGITDVQTNPEFLDILEYTRSIGVIPNFTLSGIDLTDDLADKISRLVGAVAVSAYQSNKNICYDTVRKFLDRGVKQTNIHLLYHRDNLTFVYEVLNDIMNDKRLAGLNAVVLLGLKPAGRASKMFSCDQSDFNKVVDFMFSNNIRFGFDSCSAPKFIRYVKKSDIESKDELLQVVEPCESGLFSAYINVHGEYTPCSFAEQHKDWIGGISVLKCDSFVKDIWNSERVSKHRKILLDKNRECPLYNLGDIDG